MFSVLKEKNSNSRKISVANMLKKFPTLFMHFLRQTYVCIGAMKNIILQVFEGFNAISTFSS